MIVPVAIRVGTISFILDEHSTLKKLFFIIATQ